MKKVLLLLFACGLMGMSSYAQVASYSFSQANGTFDTLVTGNVLGNTGTAAGTYFVVDTVADPAGSISVYRGMGIPIGFNFTYNGSIFNVFGVNSNGWIAFGQDSVNLNTSSVSTPISATSTARCTSEQGCGIWKEFSCTGYLTFKICYYRISAKQNADCGMEKL